MQIKLTYDSHAVLGLETWGRKQIPFASAKALTQTAISARNKVREGLPKEFVIRRPWTINGIICQTAQKSDWPNITAVVGSRDPYMIMQETGGTKTPKGKSIAIPAGVRTNVRKVVPRSKWPKALLSKGNKGKPYSYPGMPGTRKGIPNGHHGKPLPFLAEMDDLPGVWTRTGSARRRGGQKIKLLWALEMRPMQIKKRDWLFPAVEKEMNSKFAKAFELCLEEALATAK